MDNLPRDARILAEQLAEARGVTTEEAVTLALKETLERTPARSLDSPKLSGDALIKRLEEISREAAALPLLDSRSRDEILGYDEFGLPS